MVFTNRIPNFKISLDQFFGQLSKGLSQSIGAVQMLMQKGLEDKVLKGAIGVVEKKRNYSVENEAYRLEVVPSDGFQCLEAIVDIKIDTGGFDQPALAATEDTLKKKGFEKLGEYSYTNQKAGYDIILELQRMVIKHRRAEPFDIGTLERYIKTCSNYFAALMNMRAKPAKENPQEKSPDERPPAEQPPAEEPEQTKPSVSESGITMQEKPAPRKAPAPKEGEPSWAGTRRFTGQENAKYFHRRLEYGMTISDETAEQAKADLIRMVSDNGSFSVDPTDEEYVLRSRVVKVGDQELHLRESVRVTTSAVLYSLEKQEGVKERHVREGTLRVLDIVYQRAHGKPISPPASQTDIPDPPEQSPQS